MTVSAIWESVTRAEDGFIIFDSRQRWWDQHVHVDEAAARSIAERCVTGAFEIVPVRVIREDGPAPNGQSTWIFRTIFPTPAHHAHRAFRSWTVTDNPTYHGVDPSPGYVTRGRGMTEDDL